MASIITTTGTTSDPVSTTRQTGESVSEWVSRHGDAVGNATPNGNQLNTTWNSANGKTGKKTTRQTGESDANFQSRHILEYTTAMIEDPPV